MQDLQVVEIQGQRVLTSAQIASCYETTRDCIKKNFHLNKGRFIEGKHYIVLVGDELKNFKNQVENFDLVASRTSHIYLWTEKGALLHAKSLNTDKAWEVCDYLADFYFRARERPELEKTNVVPVTDTTKPLKKEVPVKSPVQKNVPRQTGYDIASAFREIISLLPVEALDEMEKCFRSNRSGALKLAATSILAEKMKRQSA